MNELKDQDIPQCDYNHGYWELWKKPDATISTWITVCIHFRAVSYTHFKKENKA